MLASLVVRSSLDRVHLTTAICGKEWRDVFTNVERKLSLLTAPKFVQGFVDRHGKPRFYFRRPGFKSVPLPGLPWSPQFCGR